MSDEPQIHPAADVEDGAVIGPRTRVWARVHIRRGARLGADCVVGENALIDLDVAVGDRCKIQAGAMLFHGSSLGDEVFVGPGAILTNDRLPRAANPDGGLKGDADWTVTPLRVGHGASIGAGAVVVAGCDVGRYALVGAGAVVTRPVPDHAVVAGNPARALGWVCACAARLDEALACASCGRRYARSGTGLAQA